MTMTRQDFANRLLDLLVAIPALDEPGHRESLLAKLPRKLRSTVPRGASASADLNAVVRFAVESGQLANDDWPALLVIDKAAELVAGTKAELDLCALAALWPTDTGPDDGPLVAPPVDPLAKVRGLGARLDARKDLHAARQALAELTRFALAVDSLAARAEAVELLRRAFFQDVGPPPVSSTLRDVRVDLMRALSELCPKDLGRHFQSGEFDGLDLLGMDFREASLKRVRFRKAFLTESRFDGCDLRGADFTGAFLRNVHFTDAVLDDADFSGADWFNAVGLTAEQLRRAKLASLAPCPDSAAAFHDYLRSRYLYAFESWEPRVQRELEATWRQYLAPGGLRQASRAWLAPAPPAAAGVEQGTSLRAVVVADLSCYSDVLKQLEQHLGLGGTRELNHQIRDLIHSALRAVGLDPLAIPYKGTGDGAIAALETAEQASRFAEELHRAAEKHNRGKDVPLAQRHFRVGVWTRTIVLDVVVSGAGEPVGFDFGGTAISNAVRLEGACLTGEVLICPDTWADLPREARALYGPAQLVRGKRTEEFLAHRRKVTDPAPWDRQGEGQPPNPR